MASIYFLHPSCCLFHTAVPFIIQNLLSVMQSHSLLLPCILYFWGLILKILAVLTLSIPMSYSYGFTVWVISFVSLIHFEMNFETGENKNLVSLFCTYWICPEPFINETALSLGVLGTCWTSVGSTCGSHLGSGLFSIGPLCQYITVLFQSQVVECLLLWYFSQDGFGYSVFCCSV